MRRNVAKTKTTSKNVAAKKNGKSTMTKSKSVAKKGATAKKSTSKVKSAAKTTPKKTAAKPKPKKAVVAKSAKAKKSSVKAAPVKKTVKKAPVKKAAAAKAAPVKKTVKKAPVKKAAAAKAAPVKKTVKKAPVKKAAAAKAAPVKKTVKKAPVKKTAATKAAPVKKTVKKAPVKKAAATKAAPVKKTVKKAPVKKAAATKAAPVKKTVKKAAAAKAAPVKKAAKKTPVKKVVPAKATPVKKTAKKTPAKVVSVEKTVTVTKNPVTKSSAKGTLIKGATLVTMNLVREIVKADIRIVDGKIESIAPTLRTRTNDTVVDAKGLTVFPGFIQLHAHFCQTIFRHMAEDLSLFDWLRQRIWPLEAAHNPASLRASTQLGIGEMLMSGTTTAFTMETTHNTEEIFSTIIESGMRCFTGKAMMDTGRGLPRKLKETTRRSLDLAKKHLANWDGKGNLKVTVCPRFAPSCSPDLLKGIANITRDSDIWIHTHVAETRDEVHLTREAFGRNPILLYEALGFLDGRFLGAHAVHLSEAEKLRLAGRRHAVLIHCPSANMKLGSGIAPLGDLLSRGIHTGLGADGAACNNSLSIIKEMRLAALLQKVSRGPGSLSAETMVELATIDAATAIGLEDQIGSIEVGKKADLVFFNLEHLAIQPAGSPAQQLVWSASDRDLIHTMIDGKFLVKNQKLRIWKVEEILSSSRKEAVKLLGRANLDGKVQLNTGR
jgi:5-methylthioadenosine/S-adenosylhomocysteine deaminase